MNYGEVLSYVISMGKVKVKPFKTWLGAAIQNWEFEIELLDVGKNIEISKAIAELPMTAMVFGAKVETLARCIISINNESFGSQEQADEYNKEHNLERDQALSTLEYKKLLIKKWDQVVINALDSEYNKLQEDQIKKLIEPATNKKEEKAKGKEEKKEKDTLNVALNDTQIGSPMPAPSIEVEAYTETKKDAQN